MWDSEPSPRTPISFRHWISEGVFTFSPNRDVSPASLPILAEQFMTPLSSAEEKFVIIPLHSPPRKPEGATKSTAECISRSSSPNIHSAVIHFENGAQLSRRSPEKRFFSPGPICRICHEGDKDESLLSPCNCSGSMQLVHKSCLEKWLSTSNSDSCELCLKQLPVRKEARPIWQWFSTSGSAHGPQGFYADLTCVILLTPLCILSIYLCAIGAADYMRHGIWEGTGLAALSCFLLGIYSVWCYITIRFHWITAQKWRTSNQVIHLVEKECRRRDQTFSRVSDSTTPRSTVVTSSGWDSPPEVQVVVFPNVSPGHQIVPLDNRAQSQPNVMDASLQGFDVPPFL